MTNQRMTPAQFAAYLDSQAGGRTADPTREQLASSDSHRRAAKGGNKFEATLRELHKVYRTQRRAFLRKCPIETMAANAHNPRHAWIPKHQIHQVRFRVGTAPVDYFGTLGRIGHSRGVSLYVEAKSTATADTRLSIGDEDKLRPEQIDELLVAAFFGAVVAIVWRNGDRVGVLLEDGIRKAMDEYTAGTRKSVPASEFTWLEEGDIDYLKVIELSLMLKEADRAD